MKLFPKLLPLFFLGLLISLSACKPKPKPNPNGNSGTVQKDPVKPIPAENTGNGGKPSRENPVMPDEIARKYRIDAARMAARELSTSTRPPAEDYYVPQDKIQTYYEWLRKAYWLSQRDPNVPDISFIRTFPNPDIFQIRVILEKDASWKKNWSEGRMATGNPDLDRLIRLHKMAIEDYREGSLGPTLLLVAGHPIVADKLSAALTEFKGIQIAEPEIVTGDGNDIEFGAEGKNGYVLKFSLGAGDCPSGCIHRQYFVFNIMQDGSMQYGGTRGEIPKELEKEIDRGRDE